MDAYDAINKGNYFYSVWHGERDIAFQCTDMDAAKARQYLEDNLLAMEQSQNDHLLYLKFHPSIIKGLSNGFIDRTTTVVSLGPVRAGELPESGGAVSGTYESQSGNMSFKMYEAVKAMQDLPAQINAAIDQKLLLFEARLQAIEEPEETETETEAVDKYIGLINGVMNNPTLSPLITAIIGRIFPPQQSQPIMQGQINGVKPSEHATPVQEAAPAEVDNEILNNALLRLNEHCNIDTDLCLLADMAEKNPGQFQMLLGMLRANG